MKKITVFATIHANIEKVWNYFTEPKHIEHWNFASPDWHCPKVENDLKVGGFFKYHMAAKDGSFAFDFGGIYSEIKFHEQINYVIGDGRKAEVVFEAKANEIIITETFEAENQNPIELQQQGWQSILNNFKNYVEKN